MNAMLRNRGGWAVCFVVLACAACRPALAQEQETPLAEPPAAAEAVAWQGNLDESLKGALERNERVLVRLGARWCGWCKKLDEELAAPDVQKELQGWTRVSIDIDDSPVEARRLAVAGVPALRVLSPTGQQIGALDGFVEAEDLLDWLVEQRTRAAPVELEILTGTAPPDQAQVEQLIELFAARDPAPREAALRRLLPYRARAADFVVEALLAEKLATRLSAYELLKEWSAPLEGIDPWKLDTLLAPEALRAWAKEVVAEEHAPAEHLSDEQRAAAGAELDELTEADDGRASILAERLVRYGRPLAELLHERIEALDDEAARQRLQALLYRVFGSPALAVEWQQGFAQLAASDAAVRHAAMQQLADRATAADGDLLLELFDHSDPFVREMALSTLKSIGGQPADEALGRLLDDPDPNVRAAVLKQLAQAPSRRMLMKVIARLFKEDDADLVAHGIRVLKAGGGARATQALVELLDHDVWQVRAEAAEALGEAVGRHSLAGRTLDEQTKAAALVRLVELLEDEDGFVVSKAMQAIKSGELLEVAVEPLVRAAANHPELSQEAIRLLAENEQTRVPAIPHFKKLLAHEQAATRGAAIEALVAIAPEEADELLAAALADGEARVRIAAARGIYAARSQAFHIAPPDEDAIRGTTPESDLSAAPHGERLKLALSDEFQPKWRDEAVVRLDAMLASESNDERQAAAVALCTLNCAEAAHDVLWSAATSWNNLKTVARALPWLEFDDRKGLLEAFLATDPPQESLVQLAQALAYLQEPQTAESMWSLAAGEEIDEQAAAMVLYSLRQAYLGDDAYNPVDADDAARQTAAAAAQGRVSQGTLQERLVALYLLAQTAPEEGAIAALAWLGDQALAHDLRQHAFRVFFRVAPADEANKLALATIGGEDRVLARMAMAHLATGADEEGALEPSPLEAMGGFPTRGVEAYSISAPTLPDPPAGLSADAVKPLLADKDADIAALAGYLLTLLEDAEGLPVVLARWREEPAAEPWRKLAYRAIASLDGDEHASELEQIYGTYQDGDYRVREFYWTIRTMTGGQARALRERVRKEVGMDRLR